MVIVKKIPSEVQARGFPRRDNIESRYRTDSRDSSYESKDRLRDYGKGKYDRTRCIRDYPVVKNRNTRKVNEKTGYMLHNMWRSGTQKYSVPAVKNISSNE